MTPIVLPEPISSTLKKYKMDYGLVSNKIYDHGDSIVSGDHCNYPKPVQTYELVIEDEPEVVEDEPEPEPEADVVNESIQQIASGKRKKKLKKSKTKKKKPKKKKP